jgi:hypothetical protein
VRQIKRAIIKPSRGGVRLDELHPQIPPRGKFARELQHPRLAVESDHASVCADLLGEQMNDTEDAAAHIDRGGARVDADQGEQLRRLRGIDVGLHDMVAYLRRTVAKQIPPGSAAFTGPHLAARLYPPQAARGGLSASTDFGPAADALRVPSP